MAKFINKRIYTDIESWMVTEIDEARGTAMATPVKKIIRPKMVPGGFAGHCPDLDREFDAAELVIVGKPFPIRRNKDGIWGFRHEVISLALPVEGCKAEWIESKRNAPDAEIADGYIWLYEMSKGGKRKTTFEKLGVLSDTCAYFYDHNF